MNEEQFRELLQEKGYGEVKVKDFEPNFYDPPHTHEVSIMGMVLSGEFTMIFEHESTTYGPGEWCENPAGTLHTEQISVNGVIALVGKK